ncbi:serine hydrolase-like protein isoform X2 [Etheostoma spectabile]|uniref:serine hydrolase-like protein isoform X2 n=1 Tax=Etheostoma spectabile TaxID=54343 RepID=UPI0013AF9732|nr:serine hydrolase-like protein isoform X2 [Etheostoma spectabile]
MLQALKSVRHLQSSAIKQAVSELCVPVPWGDLRGKIWGPDHGHPVLCLHGWADNCGTFNSLIPLLPTEFRYVALDLAGHGLSSHRSPGDFYTFPAYVMDVRRVVEALQWSKFSIIGHSMGGNVAGMFSALYPEMVDAVVLLDSYGFLPTDKNEMWKVMRQGMDQMVQFEKMTEDKKRRVYTYENAVERLMAANPTLSQRSVHILLERGLVQVEGGVAFTRDLRINLKNITRISLEQSLEMQSRIQASVLVVLAEESFKRIFFEPAQRKFISTLLQCLQDRKHMVAKVPGDHHVHLNKPEVITSFVSDFLRTKVLSQSNRQHKL